MRILIEDIETDGGTQARVELSQKAVNDYAELMKEGTIFPPVDVFHDGSQYWLADGFHRLFAWRSIGSVDIEANVHKGTVRDAKWFAFQANKDRGLSLTPADRRNIVEKLLKDEEWGKKSYSEIARHVGVSKMTVSRIAGELFNGEDQGPKTVTKQDGSEYQMQTANIGKTKSKEPKAPKETKPKEEPKEEPKQEEPKLEKDDVLSDLRHTVAELSEENSKLRDLIAVGQWDASEIEKIDVQETLEELRKENKLLRIELDAVTDSRNTFQHRNIELVKQVKALQAKLKKAGIE